MGEEKYIPSDELNSIKKYWMEKMSGDVSFVEIPGPFTRTNDYLRSEYETSIQKETYDALIKICKDQDLLLYIFLLAAYKVLLYKYCGQNDIIITSPPYIGGMKNHEIERYVLLRDSVDAELTFKEVLSDVRKTVLNGYKNQQFSGKDVLKAINCNLDDSCLRNIVSMDGIHSAPAAEDIVHSYNSDIALRIIKKHESIVTRIYFNYLLYSEGFIDTLTKCYQEILKQVTENISIKIKEIALLDDNEKHRIINNFNHRDDNLSNAQSIIGLFRSIVKEYPEKAALCVALDYKNLENITGTRLRNLYADVDVSQICKHKKINGSQAVYKEVSYRELDKITDEIACKLISNGAKPSKTVALLVKNSLSTVIGILSILKAGAAYLPIDPHEPTSRIEHILSDSNSPMLITDYELQNELNYKGTIIDINSDSKPSSSPTLPYKLENNLAYVIYTSGTTGKPKGVMVKEKGLVNFINWRMKTYNYSQDDVTLQLLPSNFDGYGTNLYSSLLSGGTLVIVEGAKYHNYSFIAQLVEDKHITNFSLVPSMYKLLLQQSENKDLSSLRFVVLGAEESDKELIEMSRQRCADTMLINEYGPTENTITTTANIGLNEESTSIIGKPISNVKVYILSKDSNIMPVGTAGELCISGTGLAKGYLNMASETEAKFIRNPLDPSLMMYRTGDIARWLPDGQIEILGRMDFQVKVRGHRVELEEIETVIMETDLVHKAVVLDEKDNFDSIKLYAYVRLKKGIKIDDLKIALKKRLPGHMIPSYFITVDSFKMNNNGKLDREALLNMDKERSIMSLYVEPRYELEKKLQEIWKKALGIDKIGIKDNFFDIGGNSLVLMRIYPEIEELCQDITVTDFFTYHTIEKLASYIDKRKPKKNIVKLKNTAFPEYFLVNESEEENNDGAKLYFNLDNNIYRRITHIAAREEIDAYEFLFSMFAYMIKELTEKTQIDIQTVIEPYQMGYEVSIDFSNVSDFSSLFAYIHNELTHPMKGSSYSLISFEDQTVSEKLELYPIFTKSNHYRNDYININGIAVEVKEDKDRISLICDYDNRKLRKNKIIAMFNGYIKLIEDFINKY